MKKIVFWAVALSLSVFAMSCHNSAKNVAMERTIMAEMISAKSPSNEVPPPPPPPKMSTLTTDEMIDYSVTPGEGKETKKEVVSTKIIKTGLLEIQSNDVKAAKTEIEKKVKEAGGYFEDETYSNSDGFGSFSLIIRVPVLKFETLLASVESGSNKIISRNIRARDVTAEYIDNKTALENNKAYLARYRELLKKAVSIKDIVDIQEKIDELELKIETAGSQLKYLINQIDFSTLEVKLVTDPSKISYKVNKPSFFSSFVLSIVSGWGSFTDFILNLISLWPYILIIAVISYLIKRWWKHRKWRKSKSAVVNDENNLQ
jgi:hypothetical protein